MSGRFLLSEARGRTRLCTYSGAGDAGHAAHRSQSRFYVHIRTRFGIAKKGFIIEGAALSGGDFIDRDHSVVCLSAEATTDWFADGKVPGSYIGAVQFHHH